MAGCPSPKYPLTALYTGQGSVVLNPAGGSYDKGQRVTVTATPAPNWHFDHWEGALSGSANPAQVTMDAAKTVKAVFLLNQQTLSVSVTGQGSVALDPPGGTYASGTPITLTATPAAHWHFDHWEGALSGNENPAQATMDADKTVTAVFVANQYALSVPVTGQGSVALNPGTGPYPALTEVTLTATPAAGWEFDHWEGALSGNINPAPITMDADKTVTAVFVTNPSQFTLDVQVTGEGSVALNPPGGLYNPGQLVTLTVAAANGWHFDHWEGALSGGATYTQVTVNTNTTVTAVFAREEYTLTVSPQGAGTVTLDPPGGTYPSGTVVTLTPAPSADARFEIWGGNLLGTRQPATVTMDGNKYVLAYFMPELLTNLQPSSLCAVGSTLYFLGIGLYSGQELWKSDGTFEGTRLVKDIAPVQDTPQIRFLTNLNGTLYFFASLNGHSLWKSDGTEDGTVKVAELGSSWPALAPVKVGAKIFWSAIGTEDGELWSSDGTEAGTGIVKSFGSLTGSNPNRLTDVDGVLYFNNMTAAETFTLWKSDGTEAGTVPIYSTRWIDEIASLNGQVFFYAGTLADDSLFTTDGTAAGTYKMRDFFFGPGDFTRSGGLLYFAAEPFDLYNTRVYATDGTSVYRISETVYRPWDLFDLNGTLLFEALYDVDSVTHCGLFASTGSGASLLREINPHLFYSVESYQAVVGNNVYFAAENSYGGLGLWKTDGTGAGTVLVSDINPTGLGPYYLTDVNGTLFFAGQDDAHGYQLWKSDGTPAGTLPVSCPTP